MPDLYLLPAAEVGCFAAMASVHRQAESLLLNLSFACVRGGVAYCVGGRRSPCKAAQTVSARVFARALDARGMRTGARMRRGCLWRGEDTGPAVPEQRDKGAVPLGGETPVLMAWRAGGAMHKSSL